MTKKERYRYVLDYFRARTPEVTTELEFGSVFQLLVAVILSAQCTDKRVNQITPALFERYPDAASMAEADADEIFEYIRSVSYPNAKAKHLVEMARMLVNCHGGEVPDDFDQLLKLPGVGRKTANVMQAVAFGRSAMAVDTHVFRVSHRIGLVPDRCTTPLSVEKELTKYIPAEVIPTAHHWLILHGRYTCIARRPKCEQCGLNLLCKHYKKEHKLREADKSETNPGTSEAK